MVPGERLSTRALILLGAVGAVVLATAIAVAQRWLPEWSASAIPSPHDFARRASAFAVAAGLEPAGTPSARLRSSAWLDDDARVENDRVWSVRGRDAARWLARRGRGPYIETAVTGAWRDDLERPGVLRVAFSRHGEPVSALWIPEELFRALEAEAKTRDARTRALAAAFAPAVPWTAGQEVEVLGRRMRLLPANADETLLAMHLVGSALPMVHRVSVPMEIQRRRLESLTIGSVGASLIWRGAAAAVLFIGTAAVFVALFVRRRIELSKGALLGAASIALSLPAIVGFAANWVEMLDLSFDVGARGIALFVLWSAAESWMRTTVPGFRSSLDTLRARQLGPASGSALLAGSAAGAGLAGLYLLGMSAASYLPAGTLRAASVRMPLFGAPASPLDEAAIRAAIVLLAAAAAARIRVLGHIPGAATFLAAFLLATRVPVDPFWLAFAIAIAIAAVLVRTHAVLGPVALLAAAVVSAVAPAAIQAAAHPEWLATSGAILWLALLIPIGAGAFGLRRSPDAERGPMPLPAFVRRVQQESRIQHEMALLARMQTNLLPAHTPQIDGWDIAARSLLANEAGGDLYDFLHDARGGLWIAAGDVSGHGYSCAIAQAMTKAGLASLVDDQRTPAGVLERLDAVLRTAGSVRTFTTLGLLRIDTTTGDAHLANAGHPYAVVVPPSGEVEEIEAPSLPLGKGPPRRYSDIVLHIAPGATIVFASDGLFEAQGESGAPYGFERLRSIVPRARSVSAADLLEIVLDDWTRHRGVVEPQDDTTVVVIRRAG